MEKRKGGVTAAKGFSAASAAAGIKYAHRRDMALIYSKRPCAAAGTFTTNVVQAAPVKWDKRIVEEAAAVHAVVVNAGIANACTGEEGLSYCRQTAECAARLLDIPADSVCVASTGVIGQQLPMERIADGIAKMAPCLSDSQEAGNEAARAIMTTDTHEKEAVAVFEAGGVTVTIGGNVAWQSQWYQ